MLVYTGIKDSKFSVLDTDDNVTELVDGVTLLDCLARVEIDGLKINDNGDIEDSFGDIVFSLPKKSKNSNLTKAKKAKNDEFYTQLSDIEKELSHYPKDIFKDKVIYCPMDVATTQGAILRSEFVHYFQMHAHELQFKELIATCLHDKATGEGYADEDVRSNNYHLKRWKVSYATPENQALCKSPVDEVKNEFGQLCYKYADGRLEPIPDNVVNECILNTDGSLVIDSEGTPQLYTYNGYFYADCKPDEDFDESDVEGSNKRGSYGSGDFRSKQCLKYLEQADIIVTNPPFSLFREFVKLIVDYNKKFIIVGNINAVTYNDIFKYIKTDDISVGFCSLTDFSDSIGNINKVPCKWFNNLNTSVMKENLFLVKTLSDKLYYKCGNYDAIYVDKIANIPSDYDGKMLVPSTFVCQYNPSQFELIGLVSKIGLEDCPKLGEEYIENYRAQGGTGHQTANEYNIWYIDNNGKYKRPYTPIVIRHRKDENGKLV